MVAHLQMTWPSDFRVGKISFPKRTKRHRLGECTKVCPKHVDPAGAIQQYKLTAATHWVKSLLLPWGTR